MSLHAPSHSSQSGLHRTVSNVLESCPVLLWATTLFKIPEWKGQGDDVEQLAKGTELYHDWTIEIDWCYLV